jgi:hypothetical protein
MWPAERSRALSHRSAGFVIRNVRLSRDYYS